MKLSIPKKSMSTRLLLQRAGYHEWRDPNTGKTSYARRLGTSHFPKFHVYVHEQGDVVVIDLHLDQKQASYRGSSMHGGEYDGSTVEQEIARLKTRSQEPVLTAPAPAPQKKSFFGSIFG